jgi:hypothetical protein
MVASQGRGPMLRLIDLLVLRRHYVPSPHLYTHPEMSPRFGDFTGLPPLLLLTGSSEMLRHEAMRTAHKAHAAGVDVELRSSSGRERRMCSRSRPSFPRLRMHGEVAVAARYGDCQGSSDGGGRQATLSVPRVRCAVDLINGPDTRQNLPAISVAQQLHPPLDKEPAIHCVAAKPVIKVLPGGVNGGSITITKTGHAKMS